MKILNSKQIEKYHKDGFLVVKNVFTREECNNFKKVLLEEIKKGKDILQKSLNKPKDVIDLNKIADVPRKINEGCLQDIAHRNLKFMSLAKDDRLISIIGQHKYESEVEGINLWLFAKGIWLPCPPKGGSCPPKGYGCPNKG